VSYFKYHDFKKKCLSVKSPNLGTTCGSGLSGLLWAQKHSHTVILIRGSNLWEVVQGVVQSLEFKSKVGLGFWPQGSGKGRDVGVAQYSIPWPGVFFGQWQNCISKQQEQQQQQSLTFSKHTFKYLFSWLRKTSSFLMQTWGIFLAKCKMWTYLCVSSPPQTWVHMSLNNWKAPF
jgi:hypothetical protein